MWIKKFEEPIPTYGKNGKEFMLALSFKKYYKHSTPKSIVALAKWDSVNEAFYEIDTGEEILKEDIVAWWKE